VISQSTLAPPAPTPARQIDVGRERIVTTNAGRRIDPGRAVAGRHSVKGTAVKIDVSVYRPSPHAAADDIELSGVTLEGRILQGGWERLVQIGDATQLGRLRFSRVIIDGSDENDRAGVTKLEERGFRTLHEPRKTSRISVVLWSRDDWQQMINPARAARCGSSRLPNQVTNCQVLPP
jgi:hypothetical protein